MSHFPQIATSPKRQLARPRVWRTVAGYQRRPPCAVGIRSAALGSAAPLAVSGVSFLILFTQLRILDHLTMVGVAITIVNLPFMLWAVAASVAAHNPELEEAAATLGAEEVQQFLFVTRPSLAPGILTGALLMFVFGITDFLVSLLLVSVSDQTLPVYVYSSIRQNVSPLLAGVAALYVLIAGLVVAVVLRVGRFQQFLYRDTP